MRQRIIRKKGAVCQTVCRICLLIFALFSAAFGPMGSGTAVYASEYDSYRPSVGETEVGGFSQLQAINPEVLGWITIYGTNIDYPLLQTGDNKKYLDTNSKGEYAITGSIFLDYRCSPHFNDFNTIIYGHHVDSGVMFGQIKKFADEAFFEEHKYGSIYYDGTEKGLEIFAILEVNAYDTEIYKPAVYGDSQRQEYYQYLLSQAKYKRNVSVTADDQIVLLSTCFVDVTNGRHILVAKVTDTVPTDNTVQTDSGDSILTKIESLPIWILYVLILILFIIVLILLIILLLILRRWRKERKIRRAAEVDGSLKN